MEFLEVPLFDDDIYKLLVRLAIDIVVLTLIVRFAIAPGLSPKDRDFAFTAVMLNIIVFFICFTMKKLELDLGLALGLFAVFGVLRYRTDAIRPKQMTYLFIVIGIAVINSLSNKKTSYAEIALVNTLIFAATMLKEYLVGSSAKSAAKLKKPIEVKKKVDDAKSNRFAIEYDRLELLGEENRNSLVDDLRERTGLVISRVEVKSIDLVENRATLTIWTPNTMDPEIT
ncbi:MAG: DUF4956 domain-containing protein [Planctomycetota bacterium]